LKKAYNIIALLITIAIAIAIISALQINSMPQGTTEDFEQNLGEEDFGEWTANAFVPPDPNSPGNPVQWHIRRASNVSHSGAYSAEFFIDGKQDDGTIWLERKISVKQNAQIRLSVSFWLYSEQESFNTIAAIVAYAGITKPKVEDDFAVVGVANEVAGWKNYAYEANVNTDSTAEAWIAVGITVRWETYLTYYIDNVRIEIA